MVLWNVADVISGCGPVGGAARSKLVNGMDVPGPSSTEVVMVNEGGAGLGGDGVVVDGSPTGAVEAEVDEVPAAAGEAAGLRYK